MRIWNGRALVIAGSAALALCWAPATPALAQALPGGFPNVGGPQKAMKSAFPDQALDRQPLPDLADDSGPILAIVSVKFDTPGPEATPARMSSIGIELYGPRNVLPVRPSARVHQAIAPRHREVAVGEEPVAEAQSLGDLLALLVGIR